MSHFPPSAARPVVLTFVRYYLPGYKSGGPIRTVSNLVAALGDDFDFRIVTSDRDATDTEPYPNLAPTGSWTQVGKAHVLYIPPDAMGLRRVAQILRRTPHDVLYLNSFFDPDFSQKPLLARRLGLAPKTRCVAAPRGEFSEGALALKTTKKKALLLTGRKLGLYRDLEWQASSAYEEADIRRTLGSTAQHIKVAINLPDMSPGAGSSFVARAPDDPLRIVFLSRISPMKNLDFALKVLAQVRTPVRFDIYGPIREKAYWSHCLSLIEQLPDCVQATYRGSVEHSKVSTILQNYDLFFLPTLGENYGHVIYEALIAGTPVLIANTTPWRNLAGNGAGWDLPLNDPQAFVKNIELAATTPLVKTSEIRTKAANFARSTIAATNLIQSNIDVFK